MTVYLFLPVNILFQNGKFEIIIYQNKNFSRVHNNLKTFLFKTCKTSLIKLLLFVF